MSTKPAFACASLTAVCAATWAAVTTAQMIASSPLPRKERTLKPSELPLGLQVVAALDLQIA
ncbi:MAG: hypothetical protein AW07_02972 [Candidatus Accumulibacter sp. SK-11]|nr:MAG: hypothetical protein AW07_02972 [Candidatus Accumulibacter sp. SK-11]